MYYKPQCYKVWRNLISPYITPECEIEIHLASECIDRGHFVQYLDDGVIEYFSERDNKNKNSSFEHVFIVRDMIGSITDEQYSFLYITKQIPLPEANSFNVAIIHMWNM